MWPRRVLLPPEILDNIVHYLTRRQDLCSTSLVSEDWWLATTPHLYRVARLNDRFDLERMAKWISNGDRRADYVRKYLRSLTLKENVFGSYYDRTSEAEVELLISSAPKLQQFIWRSALCRCIAKVCKVLCNFCPSLRFLELATTMMLSHMRGPHVNTAHGKMFNLAHLAHLKLDISLQDPDDEIIGLHPVALALRDSPRLQSLELDLLTTSESTGWSLDDLFLATSAITFPDLRTFRAFGAIDQDSCEAAFGNRSSPTFDFFIRHPNLSTIGLGYETPHKNDRLLTPELAVTLFPSVKSIRIPDLICEPILASALAGQLERLVIKTGPRLPDILYPFQAGLCAELVACIQKPLPNLRSLFVAEPHTEWGTLQRLLKLTPSLRTLESMSTICYWDPEEDEEHDKDDRSSDEDGLLATLRLVPNLRVLSWRANRAEWDNLLPSLAHELPDLKKLNGSPLDSRYRQIQRDAVKTIRAKPGSKKARCLERK